MTSGFPFTLVGPDDEHPSGCPEECPAPMHLTPSALATLRSRAVPEEAIQAALRHEARSHAARTTEEARPGWTPRVEATLTRLGIPADAIDAAREHVQKREAKEARRAVATLADRTGQIKNWKAANKARVAEHSRAYRARRRALRVVK